MIMASPQTGTTPERANPLVVHTARVAPVPVAPQPNVNAAAVASGKQGEHAPEAAVEAVALAVPFSLVADDELLKKSAPRWQRTPEQVSMDEVVKNYHDTWVKADRPSQWAAMATKRCVATYFSEVSATTKLRQRINRAAQLHEVRIRWGTSFIVTEAFIAAQRKHGVNLPDHVLGKEVVSFAVMDKRPDNLPPEKRKDALAKAQATRKANAASRSAKATGAK